MMKKIDHRKMGRSCLGWLDGWSYSSFAEYYNPRNMHYSMLRVVNDDTIQPHTDFETHPHRDMGIVTCVIEGELTHVNNMQSVSVLEHGEIQYMSMGARVFRSEKNNREEMLRLLQIWILPDRGDYTLQYDEACIPWEACENRLLHIVSGHKNAAYMEVHQDMDIYVSILSSRKELDIPVKPSRRVYLIVIEGEIKCNGICLQLRDAVEVDESLCVKTL